MLGSPSDPLLATLRQLVELLKTHNERQWAFRLGGDLERLQEGDVSAVDHLLSAYGGMGSLNDLYLCEENGHKISGVETQEMNERLRELTGTIWQLARDRRG